MKFIQLLIFFSLYAINVSESARILAVVLAGSYSNQGYFSVLWRELAIRGHEVVVLTTHPTHENISTLKEIDMSSAIQVYEKGVQSVIGCNNNKLAELSAWVRMNSELLDTEYSLPQVQNIINNPTQKFDLIMAQMGYPACHVLKEVFKCPVIAMQSMDTGNFVHEGMGNPTHAVLYPNSLFQNSIDNTFFNRLVSFLGNLMMTHLSSAYASINELNRKYIRKDLPDSRQYLNNLDMLFINDNPLFNEVRPVTPSTISLAGGMHIKPLKELPEDLKKFMDESKHGVVYFSLGSNVKSKDLSNDMLHVIMETFSQLPYNILWKFEDVHLPRQLDNVRSIKWAPQQDILRHKNVKVFITQGGLQSLEEAIFAYVPVIAIPFMSDQNANADRIAIQKIGLKMNSRSLTVQTLKEGIIEVIIDPKYKQNMKRIAQQIQDQPMAPLEKAVWWTEYILRHKTGEHLKGPKIPDYQYWYVDVITFLVVSALAFLFGVYYICKLVYIFVNNWLRKILLKVKSD